MKIDKNFDFGLKDCQGNALRIGDKIRIDYNDNTSKEFTLEWRLGVFGWVDTYSSNPNRETALIPASWFVDYNGCKVYKINK